MTIDDGSGAGQTSTDDEDPVAITEANAWAGALGGTRAERAAAAETDGIEKALLQTCQTGAGACEIFSWRSNQPDQLLRSQSTHLCVLSRVNGELNKNTTVLLHDSVNDFSSSWPNDTVDFTGNTWKLAGRQESPAGNTTLRAEAICVPLNRFFTNSGGVKWLSQGVMPALFTGSSDCNRQISADLWWGDASSFIAGLRGPFEGSGEAVWITQGTPSTPSKLFIKTQRCNAVTQAAAYSFFVGVPGWGRSPRSYCDGECLNQNGEYRVSASNGSTDTVTMAPSTLATCYFSRISGEFNGPNEDVRIFPSPPDPFGNSERWILQAKAGSGASVSANVRCVAHNQVF